MRQYTKTYSTLELREQRGDEWTIWFPAQSGMYRPAFLLAYQGRLIEAIEAAQDIRIENYGNMHGVEFRCVTKTTTITAASPLQPGWNDTQ